MKIVYIAGPFRPKIPGDCWEMECNIREAEALALEVWRLGAAAICPHANTRFFQGAAPDKIWLEGTLAILEGCDAVITTSNWKKSKGAAAEVKRAADLNIPVFHDIDDLKAWIDGQKN